MRKIVSQKGGKSRCLPYSVSKDNFRILISPLLKKNELHNLDDYFESLSSENCGYISYTGEGADKNHEALKYSLAFSANSF